MNRAYDHRHYHCLMTIGIRIYLSQQFSLLIHEVTLVLTSRNKGHYHSTLSPVCLFSIISCWFYWFWNITGSVNYESFELWKISSGKNNLVLVFTDIYILFQTYKVNVVLSIIIIVIHHRHHFHWDNHHFDKKEIFWHRSRPSMASDILSMERISITGLSGSLSWDVRWGK